MRHQRISQNLDLIRTRCIHFTNNILFHPTSSDPFPGRGVLNQLSAPREDPVQDRGVARSVDSGTKNELRLGKPPALRGVRGVFEADDPVIVRA